MAKEVKPVWLYIELECSMRHLSDRIARLGALALFGAYNPAAQEWVNSMLRQYIISGNFEIIKKALKRARLYYEKPDQKYWVYGIDVVNGQIVSECGPFTPGSFPADDKEAAELLTVTKLV